jgi:hypothetical protein
MALTGEAAEAVLVAPEVHDVTIPEPAVAAAYHQRLERFRTLYGVLRDQFWVESGTHGSSATPAAKRH